jgi:DNA polymerase-3 subunit beta
MPIKLKIEKNNFLAALGTLQNITAKKGTMAVLANILFTAENDIIELIGTDLEVGIKRWVTGEILSPGSITLPSKKLFEIVRQAGSEYIEIEEQENNWVKINTNTSVYNMAGIASDEYPQFPEYNEEELVEMDSEIIEELIEKTIFSVAQERESNFTLTGILLEKETKKKKIFLRMVSSDGHRLTIMEKEAGNNVKKLEVEKNVIIPRKGIAEIRRFCEGYENILIGLDKKQILIKNNDGLIIVRLMNGDFPDYRSILNVIKKDNIIEIDKNSFLEALKRTIIFTDETFNSIQLDIKNNKIILLSSNIDVGNAKDEIKINYKGDNISLGFNCRYLIDTLTTINGDVIKACISSDQSPCLIESDDDQGFSSIIMPMKI